VIAAIVGMLLIFLTPPMAVPDEAAHFINAYAVSKGHFFADVKDDRIGVEMPKVYVDFINKYGSVAQDKNHRYSFSDYQSESWQQQDMTEVVFYPANRLLNPIGYLISGLGIAFGNIVCLNFNLPYNLFLFGRVFNLAFYVLIIYWAIKITPRFKRTMMVTALMPMSIFLAASFSYDAVIIPICFLLFAYVLKLSAFPENTRITNHDIGTISIIAFFLGGIKQAYLPLLLTLFAIPIRRFGSKKRYIGCIFLVLIVALSSFLIPQTLNQSVTKNINQPEKEFENLQKDYIISHQDQIPIIIQNTLKEYPLFYLSGYFGILGWLDTSFPFPFLVLFYLIFISIILFDACETGHIPIRLKAFSFLAVIISIIGMFTKMYISWTSLPWVMGVGADLVAGIQGRYFIPLTLFGCILFSNNWIRNFKLLSTLDKFAVYTSRYTILIFPLLTLLIILLRFWIG
ncbi:MAG TPA: DUF2142 domain-containing protein, partial [Flexilinea sp.]|nr:DUF2142 domain-containing protein [Flexilinea sp.]